MDQDVGVLENRFHALRVGDEVGGEIAAVELHAFDHVQLGLQSLGFFDRDDAVFADLLHGLGNDLPDGLVIVGADGADLGNHAVAVDGLGQLVDFALLAVAVLVVLATDDFDGLLDTALHGHRIGPGSDRLHAFAIDGLRQDGSGGGAIAGDVGGLRRDFAHHLCAHVFQRIFEFDFFGYGDAVLGDGRRTEFLLNHNVAPLGAECDLHGIGQKVHAAEDRLPRLFSVYDLLCHNSFLLKL